MIDRRQLVLIAALVVAATLVTSSGAVSSIEASRNVHIAVAEDSSAYLGVNQTLSNTTNETTDLTLTVRNQFSSGTSLTMVTVTVSGETVDLAKHSSIDPGEQATAEFDSVSCPDSVTVKASGSGVAVWLSRSVSCG